MANGEQKGVAGRTFFGTSKKTGKDAAVIQFAYWGIKSCFDFATTIVHEFKHVEQLQKQGFSSASAIPFITLKQFIIFRWNNEEEAHEFEWNVAKEWEKNDPKITPCIERFAKSHNVFFFYRNQRKAEYIREEIIANYPAERFKREYEQLGGKNVSAAQLVSQFVTPPASEPAPSQPASPSSGSRPAAQSKSGSGTASVSVTSHCREPCKEVTITTKDQVIAFAKEILEGGVMDKCKSMKALFENFPAGFLIIKPDDLQSYETSPAMKPETRPSSQPATQSSPPPATKDRKGQVIKYFYSDEFKNIVKKWEDLYNTQRINNKIIDILEDSRDHDKALENACNKTQWKGDECQKLKKRREEENNALQKIQQSTRT